MASFSSDASLAGLKHALTDLHPGILKSLEVEHITLFPKVRERLKRYELTPTKTRRHSRQQPNNQEAA
jgi:hypothetical protein